MRHTSSPPPLTDGDFRALASFRYALRLFFAFSEEAAAAAGLTPQQYQALLAIRGHPEPELVTVGALAEQLRIAPNSAVGLVDRLVARELVERRTSPADRRSVHLVLTLAGQQMLEALAATHRAELRRLRPQVRALLDILD